MKCEAIVYDRFIKPFLTKENKNIGVELEFPLLNLNKKPINKEFALSTLEQFFSIGFKTEETDLDGNPAFITNDVGDCVSFDNSYNNIEFSLNCSDNLLEISKRFYSYLGFIQKYLLENGHVITGMGTNPYKKCIEQSHVNYPVYNMVDEYLHKFDGEKTHEFPDFPAYLSSVQTHLDVEPKNLTKAANLFAKIDFLRGLLFANSPDFELGGTLCFRDELWHKSAFGLCAKNTGAVDEEFSTIESIQQSFYDRSMFNCIRDGKYQVFEPVLLKDYFESNDEKDIQQFLSFRNVEFTCRGTLEIRSDCSQPLAEAFVPPAFNLGILINIDEATLITKKFFDGKNLKNSYLRELACKGRAIDEFNESELISYATDMTRIAYNGLLSRGLGEEALIMPLFYRAKKLQCPAKKILKMKNNIEKIIMEYAKF